VRGDIDTVRGTGITCRGSNLDETAKLGAAMEARMAIRVRFWWLVLVLLILGPLAAYLRFWLFREEIIENAERRSFVILRWSWGWPYEAATDHNGDGYLDELMRIYSPHREFSGHFGIREIWLDTDFDGRYELRYREWPDDRAEIDDDGDSVFDRSIEGDAARAYRDAALGRRKARLAVEMARQRPLQPPT
jgi:hypothetical protein